MEKKAADPSLSSPSPSSPPPPKEASFANNVKTPPPQHHSPNSCPSSSLPPPKEKKKKKKKKKKEASYTPDEAFDPFLRGDTLVINDEFVTRWLNAKEWFESGVYLPKKEKLKVPIRKIVVEAKESLVSEIRELHLGYNPVTTIDEKINLKTIWAENCGFEEVPSWIKEQKNLEFLHLSRNQISEFPDWLQNLQQLHILDLDGNQLLQNIPSPNSNLKKLDVSDCDIRSLPRDLFHHGLVQVNVSNNKGLAYLPSQSPSSPLENLNAENCAITAFHESFFRTGIRLNLKNNQISELPREEVLQYMEKEGKFGTYNSSWALGLKGIDLAFNPLVYPPKHVYEKGNDAVKTYMTNYSNSFIDSNDVTLMLIGDQTSGKTSLSLSLAGKIDSAEDIKIKDRTQAFDVLETLLDGIKVIILDLGGHKEYESSLAVLSRDNGLHGLLLNPAHFESEETLRTALKQWVEKVLNGTISPHFIIIVSKMDTIPEEEKAEKMKAVRKMLEKLVRDFTNELKVKRDSREKDLRAELQELREEIAKVTQVGALSSELKLELEKLQKNSSHIEANLSKKIYKAKNLPNFNLDCVTFISSLTHDGFDELEKNLKTCFSRLLPIRLQEHWQPTIDRLSNGYQDKAYVRFSELAENSGLIHNDLVELLKALSALGRIVWSDDPKRKAIIFHRLDELSLFMKSIFYHEMGNVLVRFAKLQQLQLALLKQRYSMGQLPLKLIESMFHHNTKHRKEAKKEICIDYNDMQLCPPNTETTEFSAFLATLEECKLVKLMEEEWRDLVMVFVPHLQFEVVADQESWIKEYSHSSVAFEVGVCFELETTVHKNKFSGCCISTLRLMEKLSTMVSGKLKQIPIENALITRVGHIEVILRHDMSYHEGRGVGLRVRIIEPEILRETAWILLNELSAKMELEDEDCNLECHLGDENCIHGKYDPNPQCHAKPLEIAMKGKRRKGGNKCDLKYCHPTQVAIDIMGQLHQGDEKARSPFSDPPPETEDLLKTQNLMTVLVSKPVPNISMIKKHPVFTKDGKEEISTHVQPVRQRMDDLSNCHTSEFVEEFSLLESNSAIITTGNWKTHMKPIFEKYDIDEKEMTGAPGSVAALVRVCRNRVAHAKLDQDEQFWSDLRAAFKWIVMHCFAVGVRLHPDPNPTLLAFAQEFLNRERNACVAAIENGEVERPCQPLLHVTVLHTDGTESKTAFYTNAMDAENQADFLQSEIRQKLPVDKDKDKGKGKGKGKGEDKGKDKAEDLPLQISYEGPVNAAGTAPKAPTPLNVPDCFTSLSLDTQYTHLVYVKEKWDIQVEIDAPGGTIKGTFLSCDKVETIKTFVEDTTHLVNVKLYLGSKFVNSKSYLGSVCPEASCQLFATHDADKDRQTAHFAKFPKLKKAT